MRTAGRLLGWMLVLASTACAGPSNYGSFQENWEQESAGLGPAAKPHQDPDEQCLVDAASAHQRSKDEGWAKFARCVRDQYDPTPQILLREPWLNEICARGEEGLGLVFHVLRRRPDDVDATVAQLVSAGAPLLSLSQSDADLRRARGLAIGRALVVSDSHGAKGAMLHLAPLQVQKVATPTYSKHHTERELGLVKDRNGVLWREIEVTEHRSHHMRAAKADMPERELRVRWSPSRDVEHWSELIYFVRVEPGGKRGPILTLIDGAVYKTARGHRK